MIRTYQVSEHRYPKAGQKGHGALCLFLNKIQTSLKKGSLLHIGQLRPKRDQHGSTQSLLPPVPGVIVPIATQNLNYCFCQHEES